MAGPTIPKSLQPPQGYGPSKIVQSRPQTKQVVTQTFKPQVDNESAWEQAWQIFNDGHAGEYVYHMSREARTDPQIKQIRTYLQQLLEAQKVGDIAPRSTLKNVGLTYKQYANRYVYSKELEDLGYYDPKREDEFETDLEGNVYYVPGGKGTGMSIAPSLQNQGPKIPDVPTAPQSSNQYQYDPAITPGREQKLVVTAVQPPTSYYESQGLMGYGQATVASIKRFLPAVGEEAKATARLERVPSFGNIFYGSTEPFGDVGKRKTLTFSEPQFGTITDKGPEIKRDITTTSRSGSTVRGAALVAGVLTDVYLTGKISKGSPKNIRVSADIEKLKDLEKSKAVGLGLDVGESNGFRIITGRSIKKIPDAELQTERVAEIISKKKLASGDEIIKMRGNVKQDLTYVSFDESAMAGRPVEVKVSKTYGAFDKVRVKEGRFVEMGSDGLKTPLKPGEIKTFAGKGYRFPKDGDYSMTKYRTGGQVTTVDDVAIGIGGRADKAIKDKGFIGLRARQEQLVFSKRARKPLIKDGKVVMDEPPKETINFIAPGYKPIPLKRVPRKTPRLDFTPDDYTPIQIKKGPAKAEDISDISPWGIRKTKKIQKTSKLKDSEVETISQYLGGEAPIKIPKVEETRVPTFSTSLDQSRSKTDSFGVMSLTKQDTASKKASQERKDSSSEMVQGDQMSFVSGDDTMLSFASITGFSSATASKTKTVTGTTYFPGGPDFFVPGGGVPPPLKIMRVDLPGEGKTFRKEERIGYDAYAMEEGRYRKLNTKPQSKSGALDMMARVVDNTLSARGKIKPIKQTKTIKGKKVKGVKIFEKPLPKGDGYYNANSMKFRNYKISKGRQIPTNTFVEKKPYRLDQPGETRKIVKVRDNPITGKRRKRGLFRL